MADVTKINGYIIKDANAPHPSNAGSAGQVLKKTETGTEWADESGGVGTQLYLHTLEINFLSDKTNRPSITVSFVSNSSTSYGINNFPQAKIACSGSTQNNAIIEALQYNGDFSFTLTLREPSDLTTTTLNERADTAFNTIVTPL